MRELTVNMLFDKVLGLLPPKVAQCQARPAITPDTRLVDLGLDSLDRIELLFELEGMFHVVIADDALKVMQTVQDLVVLLHRAIHATDMSRHAEER